MPPPTLIPLALPAPVVNGEIHIELQRTDTTVKIVWPAASQRAAKPGLKMVPTEQPT